MTNWNLQTKNTTTWTDQDKSVVLNYLLREQGSYLLLENGGKIILNDSTSVGNNWNYQVKN